MSSLAYLAAANVVIWIGLFAYVWRLDRRMRAMGAMGGTDAAGRERNG